MTRSAREERGRDAARRGEQEWAVQAYLNLSSLLDAPLEPASRATLEKFLRQCPPSLKAIATRVVAEAAGTEAVEIPDEDLMRAVLLQPGDSEARTPDRYPGRGGW